MTDHILITKTGIFHNIVNILSGREFGETTVNDMFKIIPCLEASKFERNILEYAPNNLPLSYSGPRSMTMATILPLKCSYEKGPKWSAPFSI